MKDVDINVLDSYRTRVKELESRMLQNFKMLEECSDKLVKLDQKNTLLSET